MPEYLVEYKMVDVHDGKTSKRFVGDFVDYATARAAANALSADIQNAVDAWVYEERLTEVNAIAGAAGPNSNVFEVADATVELSAGKNANFKLPSPAESIFSGNALNPAATAWTDLMANFVSDWTISDGESIGSTVRGKRAYVSSGRTNLPS